MSSKVVSQASIETSTKVIQCKIIIMRFHHYHAGIVQVRNRVNGIVFEMLVHWSVAYLVVVFILMIDPSVVFDAAAAVVAAVALVMHMHLHIKCIPVMWCITQKTVAVTINHFSHRSSYHAPVALV